MLERPGIRTKEGLKTTGVYSVVVFLLSSTVVPYLFPDVDPETIVGAASEVRDMYHQAKEIDWAQVVQGFYETISDLIKITVSAMLLNGKRKIREHIPEEISDELLENIVKRIKERE